MAEGCEPPRTPRCPKHLKWPPLLIATFGDTLQGLSLILITLLGREGEEESRKRVSRNPTGSEAAWRDLWAGTGSVALHSSPQRRRDGATAPQHISLPLMRKRLLRLSLEQVLKVTPAGVEMNWDWIRVQT